MVNSEDEKERREIIKESFLLRGDAMMEQDLLESSFRAGEVAKEGNFLFS